MANAIMIKTADSDALSAMRDNINVGVRERITFEVAANAGKTDSKSLANIERCLDNAARYNAFTLHYLASVAFDFSAYVNSTKHDGKRANVYSISKLEIIANVLNGGSFVPDSDSRTTAATLLALKAGHLTGAAINKFVDAKMTEWNCGGSAGYTSGATQSGSSLRALEALGVVKRDGARAWQDSEEFKRCVAKASAGDKSGMFIKTKREE